MATHGQQDQSWGGRSAADSSFGLGCNFELVSVINTEATIENKPACSALVVVQIKNGHHARLTGTMVYIPITSTRNVPNFVNRGRIAARSGNSSKTPSIKSSSLLLGEGLS